MDARPTREQRELADAAARLAERLGPRTIGDLDDLDRRSRLVAALSQTGWRELRSGSIEEPVASGVEAALVTLALARRACDTAFVGPVLAHDLARRAGAESGGAAATIVVSADLGGLVRSDGSTTGLPGLAIDADGATSGLALAGTGSGHSLVGLALATPRGGVDLTRSLVNVAADSPVSVLQGTGPISDESLLAWEALAVTLTAADLVGAMEGALNLAVEYAQQRRQFNAPIGSYQAVQHLLAECRTLAEGSLSAMVYAAWAVDALPPSEARQAAAVAKAYAARAARTVCEASIQVHGGIGNTWECLAHVFLRRTLLDTELFGDDGTQLALLANHRWGAAHGFQ